MKEIDKLALIEIKDRKILSTRSKTKDTYYIPGGKREGNESDEEALVREIKEELSVDLDGNTLQFFGVFKAQAHGKTEGVIVKMTCYTGSYTGELKANSEIAEIVWLEHKDKRNSSPVDNIILDYCKDKGLID
ncbi:MAG: NUDIX domain-containing protein [Symploca sp. SIO2D2]|nr:NUDIX domain-containing protein [Symploca sp. SIO2D2]